MSGRGQAVTAEQPIGDVSPITVIIPGLVGITANDILAVWYRVTRPNGDTFKPGKVYLTAKGQAASSAVNFDLKVSTNNGSTWTTALHTGNPIQLPTGTHHNEMTTLVWDITDFHDGDLLRVDLTQADTAAFGIMFQIFPVP